MFPRGGGGDTGGARSPGPPRRAAGSAPEPLSFSPAAGGAELEVVIPERVALEKIHLLPPAVRGDRGGPRRRRALPRQRAAEEGALLLRLPAAGAELYLHLRRDLRFLARGFVVEQRPGQARRAPGPRRPPEERLCFYTGRVLNRSDSFASLSTCAGLVLPPTHLSSARAALPTAPAPCCGEPLRRPGEAFPVSPGAARAPTPRPARAGSGRWARPAPHLSTVHLLPAPSPPPALASMATVPLWVFCLLGLSAVGAASASPVSGRPRTSAAAWVAWGAVEGHPG